MLRKLGSAQAPQPRRAARACVPRVGDVCAPPPARDPRVSSTTVIEKERCKNGFSALVLCFVFAVAGRREPAPPLRTFDAAQAHAAARLRPRGNAQTAVHGERRRWYER